MCVRMPPVVCLFHRLSPVELDLTLCRMADVYCEEMIHNGYTGHISLDGRTPYQRYV